MKAVMLTENGIEFREVELGALSRDWARIRVVKAGLCGSDIAKISAPSLPAWHTRILGHEFYGEIIELGGPSEHVSVGDRVVVMPLLPCGSCEACGRGQENLCVHGQAIGRTVQGAFAEFVDAPITNIVRISSSSQLELESYALVDPLAVCVHAINLVGMSDSQHRCLIIGDGTIGCLLAWLLKARGCAVSIKGVHEEALRFIAGFGVDVADAIQARYFDAVFEAVGRSQHHSLDSSLKAVRWGGVVVILGVFTHGYEYPLVARDLFIGEVKVIGANAYLRSDFEEAVRMIEVHGEKLRTFISHRFPFFRFKDALTTAKSKHGYTMKIVLEMEGLLP